jgi:hypothetical protein
LLGIERRREAPGGHPASYRKGDTEADLTFPGIHLVELAKIRAVKGTGPDTRSD